MSSRPNDDSSSKIIIILLGPTGSGKTHFINTIAGTSNGIEHANLQGGTREITSNTIDNFGRRLVFIDTPGLASMHWDDTRVFQQVTYWLKNNTASNTKLKWIMYLHRITDNRIHGDPQIILQKFRDVSTLRFRLVTTMWDEVLDTTMAEGREEELKVAFGRELGEIRRFENRADSAWNIVNKIVRVSTGDDERETLREELEAQEHSPSDSTVEMICSRLRALLSERKEVLNQLANEAGANGDLDRAQRFQAEIERIDAQIKRTTPEGIIKTRTSLRKLVLLWLSRLVPKN